MAIVCGMAAGVAAVTMAGPVPVGVAPLARTTQAGFVASEMTMRLEPARPMRVLAVRLEHAPDADVVADVESDHPDVLAVERGARILPGQSMGYALVRTVGVGEATLRTGSSTVRVKVVPGTIGVEDAGMAFGPTPRLVSPTGGAGVWGTVHVSAAAWREDGETNPKVRLRVGGEEHAVMLDPVWMNAATDGPLALASFAVDLSGRQPGPCELRIVRTDARGIEHPGDAAVVQVVAPDSASLLSGECETDYGIILPGQFGPPTPRPKGAVADDAAASGGKFFNNAAAEPRFRYEVDVPSDKGAGWYQVMLTAGGDASCAAMPSVGITIDEAQRPTTASAIAQPAWHRTPIGTPVLLEPGRHVLRCDFVNDFAAKGTDRNLRLDKIEVLRVAGAGGTGTGAAHGDKMMSDAGAMMATQSEGSGGDQMMMSGGGGGAAASGAWPASARTATRPAVRIAFDRPIDGLAVMGEIEVRGTVWWEDQKGTPPPQVALIVNGRERARQRSDSPRFALVPESLAIGNNTVQLVATTDTGMRTETAIQRIVLPQGLARTSSSEEVRATRRLTIYDPVWTPSFGKSLKDAGGDQRKSGALAMSSQVAVELPQDLHGDFDVWVECRSNVKPGAAERRVDLEAENGDRADAIGPPRPVASRTAPNWFDAHRFTTDAAPLRLTGGPQRLWISVPSADGNWTPGKGSKEAVYIQGIRLVERTARTDAPAKVALQYPTDGQSVFGADAIVATAMDANALEWVKPLLDGKPVEGLRFDLKRQGGLGRVVVPLSLRGLPAGDHRVGLRIGNTRGHITDSESRIVKVLAVAPEGGTTYERAITILDRFAYGPESRELGDILAMGIDGYLTARLASGTGADPSDAAAMDLGGVRFTNLRSGYDVPRRAIEQSITTGNPVRNRFTLWAENHFSTWVRKDEAWRKWDEHERFSALGVATFYDLLSASATSPAMLRYLDQEHSYAGKLNENYAREIMELHTLGVHGGYTQQDVTNLAHVLTGWTTARVALAAVPEATADEDGLVEEFRFEPAVASKLGEFRDVVGYRFGPREKADQHGRVLLALEILAAHPSTAKFVCTKLVNHYVGVGAPEALIDDLASTFTRSGGDMKEVLLALSHHPTFWSAAASKRLSHPTDYAFRLSRCAAWNGPHEIGEFLAASGHGLFDRPTPDGYPELDTEAMDSNAILQRWKLASKADGAMADGLPPGIRWSEGPMTDATRQLVVDLLAIRLTGRLLGEASNTEALNVLEKAAPPTAADTPVDQRNHDGQVKTCAAFIAQLPEANVR
jgi:uncharacterized protein (DUF1800 family)